MVTLETLGIIAKREGLPTHHRGDLILDAKTLGESTEPYIWFLKPAGTITVPVGKGVNPAYIQTFMDLPHAAFFVTEGTITPINDDALLDIIHRQPIDFDSIRNMKQLVDSVDSVLSGPALNLANDIETPISSWKTWRDYFRIGGNSLMEKVMDQAIMFANQLEEERGHA